MPLMDFCEFRGHQETQTKKSPTRFRVPEPSELQKLQKPIVCVSHERRVFLGNGVVLEGSITRNNIQKSQQQCKP